MGTDAVIAEVRGDLYASLGLDAYLEPRGRGRSRTTRLVRRRDGRVLAEGSGVRSREDLLRTLRILTPAAVDAGYEAWAESFDATLPPVTSQGEPG